ncbi:MAG: phage major capsid protein [Roseateles sp.]|uniref:phage major capsid protein n=1 Tax=Roseateles sp. TaxID=1971397 RepID=UPI00403551F7
MRSINHHRHVWNSRRAAVLAMVASVGMRADDEDPITVGYRTRQEDLIQRSNAILAQADTEGRELSQQERGEIGDNTAAVEQLETDIQLRASVARQEARQRQPQARVTPANSGEPAPQDEQRPQAGARQPVIQTTHLNTPATRAAARGNGGFQTMGHWAMAVRAASLNPTSMDGRLQAALTTYGSEGAGSDGGFAVPTDYRNEVIRLGMLSEDSLFNRCDTTPTNSNSVTLVKDETTPWSTSGVRVYTRTEAQAMTQSKPVLGDMTVKLHETYAFVPMTDELLADAPMLSSYLTTKAGEAFQFKLNDYIVNGTGAGQILGILNSPALITVGKETSQTADTVHADNIVKMWSRMPAAARSRSVWLVNQDVEPQLMQLGSVVKTATGTAVGGMPSYLPPGGLSASPYGTLLGRPVVVTEACQALGDKGDIILAYLPGFFAPYKGGLKSDVSMHLFFDQGVTAFRWTLRAGGQPWLSAPIARKNGGNTLSHFVTLEAR